MNTPLVPTFPDTDPNSAKVNVGSIKGGPQLMNNVGFTPLQFQINSKDAAKKLAMLGFDPIEKTVEIYLQTQRDIDILTNDEDGLPRKNFNRMAHLGYLALLQKCTEALIKYGYAPADIDAKDKAKTLPPMMVNLTANKEAFNKINNNAALKKMSDDAEDADFSD